MHCASSYCHQEAQVRIQMQHCAITLSIELSKSELVAIGYSGVAIDAFWEMYEGYLAAMEMRPHAELMRGF